MKQKYHCRFKMLSTTKRPAVESLHRADMCKRSSVTAASTQEIMHHCREPS